jgi:DNA polymerase-1
VHFCPVGGRVVSLDVASGGGENAEELLSIIEGLGNRITTFSSKNLIKQLAALGAPPGPIDFDVELAGYLLEAGRERDLAMLCAQYLGRLPAGLAASQVQGTLGLSGAGSRPEGGAVARAVSELAPVLEDLLEAQDLLPLYRDIELPLARVLADMERTGVKVEVEFLRRMSEELGRRIAEIEERIYGEAGERFNIASPQQLKKILFDVLGLAPGKRTKTGFSTDSSVLEVLAGEHEVPRLVLEYRQLAKLKSTYLDALPSMVDPATGRIHTTFHQTVTATGRLSSSDPNLQNIPMRTELGRELRKAFISSGPDWRIYSVDYSQIELRITAHLAGDGGLTDAFRRGEDIHRVTAAAVAKTDPGDVSPAARDRAKAVNFGIIYGMGPRALARSAGMEFAEAKAFIERYFETYPGVRDFIDRTVAQARVQGYVTTLFGRRRYLPELRSENPRDRAFGERTAVNTRVQGTAADIIKKAMVEIARRIEDKGLRARMILQVHDELVFDVPAEEMDALAPMVEKAMVSAAPLDVPVSVTGGVGMNWFEAH